MSCSKSTEPVGASTASWPSSTHRERSRSSGTCAGVGLERVVLVARRGRLSRPAARRRPAGRGGAPPRVGRPRTRRPARTALRVLLAARSAGRWVSAITSARSSARARRSTSATSAEPHPAAAYGGIDVDLEPRLVGVVEQGEPERGGADAGGRPRGPAEQLLPLAAVGGAAGAGVLLRGSTTASTPGPRAGGGCAPPRASCTRSSSASSALGHLTDIRAPAAGSRGRGSAQGFWLRAASQVAAPGRPAGRSAPARPGSRPSRTAR